MTDKEIVAALAQRTATNHSEAHELLGLAQEALDSTGDDYSDTELFEFALDLHEESLL